MHRMYTATNIRMDCPTSLISCRMVREMSQGRKALLSCHAIRYGAVWFSDIKPTMPACPITNEHKRYISWCKLTLVGANLHKEDPSQTSMHTKLTTRAYKTMINKTRKKEDKILCENKNCMWHRQHSHMELLYPLMSFKLESRNLHSKKKFNTCMAHLTNDSTYTHLKYTHTLVATYMHTFRATADLFRGSHYTLISTLLYTNLAGRNS